jgi:hypothetical protein
VNRQYQRWKKLLLFSIGLAIASGFCMKWIESELWYGQEKISIIGLELFYPKEKVTEILAGVSEHVRITLRFHLVFDYAFMAGVYPGIASLCMMAGMKIASAWLKNGLFILAWLQLPAWVCDVWENYYLLAWLNKPEIGNEFLLFHFVSIVKWILALTGALVSIPLFIMYRRKRVEN